MSDNSYSSSFTVWTNGKQNTNSAQPVLNAYRNGTVSNVTGDATVYTIIFNTAAVDTAAALNTSTGVYTFPKTGKYQGSIQIQMLGLTSSHTLTQASLVTTSQTYAFFDMSPTAIKDVGGNLIIAAPFTCLVTAGDTGYISWSVSNGTKVVSLFGVTPFYTRWSMSLIA